MPSESLRYLLEFAVDVAWRAGRSTLARFQAGTDIEWKRDGSPVTAADREAEKLMRQRIEQQFPTDGILGEEFAATRPESARRWILDPIDGTRSFIHGVPLYGTLVALEERGQPLLGVICLPALEETVAAALGEGCWWNGRRARVSATSVLAEALVLTTSARPMNGAFGARWQHLCQQVQTCRTWGDCYGYALVATGRAEAMIDPRLAVWDAAAVLPIIAEAGGLTTDFQGRVRHDGGNLIATNAMLADDIRAAFLESS